MSTTVCSRQCELSSGIIFEIGFLVAFLAKFALVKQKSRIQETKNLSTDADSRTDTILERLRDLYNIKTKKIYI